MRESESALKLFRALVDRTNDAIEVFDPKTGRFLDVNNRGCLDLGYSREEFLALSVFDVDPMVHQSAFPKLVEELRKSGVLMWQGIHRRKDGSTFPVEVNLKYVPLDRDYVVTVVRDITKRKRAEQAALEQFKLSEAFFNNSVSCLVVLDKNLNFLRVNEAYARACRKDISEFVGRNHFDMYPSDAKLIFEEVVRTKTPFTTFTRVFVFPDQPERGVTYWDWTLVPVLDQQGEVECLVFSLNEVTERKRAEEALCALSLQLIRAEDAERRRIARELHDSTGQKLATLSMTVGMLQDATGAPAGKSEKMLADCLATIEQCAQEIRTLAYLLHPPLLDELGLAAAVRNYVEGFSKRSGMQVAFDAPPDLERLPDEIEIALFRVVQESLGNIHRHAGAATARLRLACDAEQVTLEVSDQGRGMSAQTICAIEAGRGLAGVGIAGMRERLRLLGGRLEIESGDSGTTMRAVVPIAGGRRG